MSGRRTVLKVKEPKKYHHIQKLQQDIVMAYVDDEESFTRKTELAEHDPQRVMPNIAPIPAPSTAELLAQHRTVFELPSTCGNILGDTSTDFF